ncbi:MAG: amino acid ABC transporter permease [Parvibaculaceae bacterium]
MEFDFLIMADYWRELLGGLIGTLRIALGSLLIGLLLGLAIAVLRSSRRRWIRAGALIYTEFFRTVPPLVQIVWVYFVLPPLLGVDISSFTAALLALGLNIAAFFAEIFRAGIQVVDPGQWRACRVLGLGPLDTWLRVILPQAMRAVLAPTATTVVLLIKSTALASVIGALEVMRVGQLISLETFRPLEVLTAVAVIYFVLTYPVLILARAIERRRALA